jgi:hypothetical protein
MKDHNGNKYNLPDYTDNETGFISVKSKNGKDFQPRQNRQRFAAAGASVRTRHFRPANFRQMTEQMFWLLPILGK